MADFIRIGNRVINTDKIEMVNLSAGADGKNVTIHWNDGERTYAGAEAEALRKHFDAVSGGDLMEVYPVAQTATA